MEFFIAGPNMAAAKQFLKRLRHLLLLLLACLVVMVLVLLQVGAC